MKNLNQTQKVKYAVLNAPYLIPLYMKAPYNPVITKSILKRMLNRSCGIEIECFGSLRWQFDSNWKVNQLVRDYYNIMDYSEDNPPSCQEYADKDSEWNGFNEHKIRISDYKQINGLYDILTDMKQYCRLNLQSGIHIHVDISDLCNGAMGTLEIERLFRTYLEPRMDEIEHIFYPNGKYTGTYNHFKEITWGKLQYWVALRSSYHTIEFRIAPMSFEYTDIIRWCVELTALVNWTIKQAPNSNALNVRAKVKQKKPIKILGRIPLPSRATASIEALIDEPDDIDEEYDISEDDGNCMCPVCIRGRQMDEEFRLRPIQQIELDMHCNEIDSIYNARLAMYERARNNIANMQL